MISAQQVVSPAFQAFLQRVRSLKIRSLVDQLDRSPTSMNWTEAQKVKTITQYFAFLYLVDCYPHLKLIPCRDVAHVWNCHRLNIRQYIADCQILFGRVPAAAAFNDLAPNDRPGKRTALFLTERLFRQHFGCSIADDIAPPNSGDCIVASSSERVKQ